MRADDVRVPATLAADAAREVAAEFCSPALLNHSQRSYYFAVGFASVAALDFDAELLYVSALLHDLGLTEAFDNHRIAFETAGGYVAWVLAAGAGWPADRRRRAASRRSSAIIHWSGRCLRAEPVEAQPDALRQTQGASAPTTAGQSR